MVKVVFSLMLFSLILFLPCQIGEEGVREAPNGAALAVPRPDLGQPLANAGFTPPYLITPIEAASATLSSVPTGPTVIPSLAVSVTAMPKPVSPAAIVTSTGFVEVAHLATPTGIATDVLRAKTTPVPLLDSLVRNRPSIWGNKGFYVLLGLVYIVLLGLFIKQILSSVGRKP